LLKWGHSGEEVGSQKGARKGGGVWARQRVVKGVGTQQRTKHQWKIKPKKAGGVPRKRKKGGP